MVNRHFYGHHNRYGVGTVFQQNNGMIDHLPGTIYRFPSRAARDAWVADDTWDGSFHREKVSAAEVRAVVERGARRFQAPSWENDDPVTGEILPYETLRG